MVRPVVTTEDTELGLLGNAKNWLHTELGILKDHYKEHLAKAINQIKKLNKARERKSWQIAIKWARKKPQDAQKQHDQSSYRGGGEFVGG